MRSQTKPRTKKSREKIRRCVAYLRVSTKEQEASELSLKAQERAIRKYADDKGYEVVKVFKDAGSGRDENRKDYKRMIEFAFVGANEIDGVLVYVWGMYDSRRRSALLSPKPSRSRSRVVRWGAPFQSVNSAAPLSTN